MNVVTDARSRTRWHGWQVEDRGRATGKRLAGYRAVGIVLGVLVSALITEAGGTSALKVAEVIGQTVSSYNGLADIIVVAGPVVMTGLAVALALRAHLWNLGGDGQLLMGAWAAAGVGLHLRAPDAVVFVLMAVAAAVAGGVWAGVAGLARAYWNVSELLTTLLLNFIAGLWVVYFVTGPWRADAFGALGATERIDQSFPSIASGRAHIGFVVPLVLAVLLVALLRRTTWGYELSVIGEGHGVARYATVRLRARVTQVLVASGMIAGLAGAIEVTGTLHRLTASVTNNYGLYGVIVAVIAQNSPLGVLVAGTAVGVLLNAGVTLRSLGVSSNLVLVVNALLLLSVVIADVVSRYRLVRPHVEARITLGTGAAS